MATPKINRIPQELYDIKTPDEPVQLPWDPRSPMFGRSPIPLDVTAAAETPDHKNHHNSHQNTSALTADSASSSFNPLDPRSPLLNGNRTPIPAENFSDNSTPAPSPSVVAGGKNRQQKKNTNNNNNKGGGGNARKNGGQANQSKSNNGSQQQHQQNNANNNNKKEVRKKKMLVTNAEPKPIKRQIAFGDATNLTVGTNES